MKKLIALLPVLFLFGCSMTAPNYTPEASNFSMLSQNVEQPLKTGSFSLKDDQLNRVTLRGSSLKSPYGNNDYAMYLKSALDSEIEMAGLKDDASSTVISGELLENDVNVAGFANGMTTVSARFIVSKNEQRSYDKVLTESYEYDSSFAGAIAIPNGVNSYSKAVQRLINQLFSDQDFIRSVR